MKDDDLPKHSKQSVNDEIAGDNRFPYAISIFSPVLLINNKCLEKELEDLVCREIIQIIRNNKNIIRIILKSHPIVSDIDLTDPELENAANKIAAAFKGKILVYNNLFLRYYLTYKCHIIISTTMQIIICSILFALVYMHIYLYIYSLNNL